MKNQSWKDKLSPIPLEITCQSIEKVSSSYGGSLGGQEQQLHITLRMVDIEKILQQIYAHHGDDVITWLID